MRIHGNRYQSKQLNTSFQNSDKKKGHKVTRLVLRKRDEYLPPIDRRTNSCQYVRPEDDNMDYVPDRWSPTGWKYKIKNDKLNSGDYYNESYKKLYPYLNKVNLLNKYRENTILAIRKNMIMESKENQSFTNV